MSEGDAAPIQLRSKAKSVIGNLMIINDGLGSLHHVQEESVTM